FQVSLVGEVQRVFGEKDGLLMNSIRSFAYFKGQLWIGFGSADRGGIGYLEVASGKFTALTPPAMLVSRAERPYGPPPCPVTPIKTNDNNTLWIGRSSALKRFDF